jgi:CMP-N,N'-diacetyllegionaminic acid synthase
MKTLAIVPCKALSTRLPKKNLMRVGGQTLVERAVFVAHGLDAVVLASDDEQIIEHGTRMAERIRLRAIPFLLTPELAGQRTSLEDVIEAVIARYPADRYVLLQPTSPLRKRRHVASALAILATTGCDSVVSVHDTTCDVYFAGVCFKDPSDAAGSPMRWRQLRPEGQRLFTNDLSKTYSENGACYAWTHAHWGRTRDRKGGDCRCMEMDAMDAIDINTPADLERAQKAWSWDAMERNEP